MTDENLRAAYQQLLATRSSAANSSRTDNRQQCVSPDALLNVVERRGSMAERELTLRHVAECADCRRDLDLLRAVKVTRPSVARRMLPLAAAASLLLATSLTFVMRARRDADVSRGSSDVTLLAPRGDVSRVQILRLVWAAVNDANAYSVQILDSAGVTVFTRTTADTTVEIPADSALATAREYVWSVTAQLNDGRERRSEPARFRVLAR